MWEAEDKIGNYFEFYDARRCYSALGYKTPEEVYLKTRDVTSKINMPAEREETKLRNASFLS